MPTDEPSEPDRLGANEIAFLESRDSFYLATVSETPRFTEREIAEAVRPLREHLEALETENATLRGRLAGIDTSS